MQADNNHLDYKLGSQSMKASITHLTKPNPFVYWSDLILTIYLSWTMFFYAEKFSHTTFLYFFLLSLSAIGFYRAVAFTHELAHLNKGAVPGFSLFWHAVCGVPLLAPHFLYRAVHLAHHNKRHYGKMSDGEYIGFGTRSRWLIFLHLFYNFIIPLLSIFRFMILAPVSLCNDKLRLFVMKNMSFMGLKFTFTRSIPTKKTDVTNWYVAEFACSLYCWLTFLLLIANITPIIFLYQWYAIMVVVLTLNSLRSLGATHWYKSQGDELNFNEQIMDSISIKSNSLFTKILCPVETQYHGLHHMFPSIPYHALGKAHKHLLINFPNEKILQETTRNDLFSSWKEMWILPRGKL